MNEGPCSFKRRIFAPFYRALEQTAFLFTALPFLKRTQVLLTPFTVLFILYLISVLVGWNFSKGLCYFYRYRVW